MNFLIAAHLLFVAIGVGGAASLYAAANEAGRGVVERVTWAGLIGAMVTGPVYGLSRPALLDGTIVAKTVLGVLLVVGLYLLSDRFPEMDAGQRSTALLGFLAAFLVALFLGVQAAHP